MNAVHAAAIVLVALALAGCLTVAGGRPEPGRVGCRDEGPPGSPGTGAPPLFFIFCTQSP